MGRYATILGLSDDARDWAARAEKIKDAFNRRCFDEAGGFYGNGSQTSQVLPLAFGMAPEARRERVVRRLLDKIENESRGHIGTGLIGTAWLMRTLSDAGHADVAYEIATQTTYPSWGYMVSKGATTVWELWNGDTADPAMNSGNHLMLIGDLGIWMHEYLGGIRPDPERPAFKHILLKPCPAGDLRWARTAYESMHGRIESAWRIEGGRFVWSVTAPPNTTATVFVPSKSAAAVTEGGKPAAEATGVKFLRVEAAAAVFEVGSGRYVFAAPV
jgi:alpha-L-rhamnosidase